MNKFRDREDAFLEIVGPHMPVPAGRGGVTYNLEQIMEETLVRRDGNWTLAPGVDLSSQKFQEMCRKHVIGHVDPPSPSDSHDRLSNS